MSRVNDWMIDMEMTTEEVVEEFIKENPDLTVSEVVLEVTERMNPMPIDRIFVYNYAKKCLELMA